MELNELNSSLEFIEGENGLLYKKIDGFLYTLSIKPELAVIYVNLPEVSRNEKKMISAYLKESVLHYVKSNFIKDGVQISFTTGILETPDYILQFAKMFSAYLSTASIEFSNSEIDVTFNKTMYAFLPVEQPIDNKKLIKKKKVEDTQGRGLNRVLSGISTQIALIIVYGVLALIYALISVFAIKFAGAVGYLMGWLPSLVLVKKNYSAKAIYTCTSIVSLIVLLLTTVYVFLFYFLSQQEIYTASEFIMQSLTPSHCVFNMTLAYLLSIFGAYSTVPAKKNKTDVEDDFS